MKIAIIIPAHNEERYIESCLNSLCNQTYLPVSLIVVDDHSTDATPKIVETFAKQYKFVELVHHVSSDAHTPGSKIINAFYAGFERLSKNYDVICKFDADLIFPKNYLIELSKAFLSNPKLGMFAGFCYIQLNNGKWKKEQLSNDDHIRGPLKAYRKECFEAIGGLQKEMGWDTLDELLARYHGWETQTQASLKVKHLKLTGQLYSSTLATKYGRALYQMDFRFCLSFLSLLKQSLLKKQLSFFVQGIKSYLSAAFLEKPSKMVTQAEGKFIRTYRWKMMGKKLGLSK